MVYDTKELAGMRKYMADSGVPHRVTFTWGGTHVASSLHYKGRAMDVAGPEPSRNSPALLAIFRVLELVKDVTYELFYGGPGGALYKSGMPISNESLRKSHEDHVHVSVEAGVVLAFPFKETSMPVDDPNLPNIAGPELEFHPVFNAQGDCTGYYIFSTMTGELHAFGPGAKFFGRSEILKP